MPSDKRDIDTLLAYVTIGAASLFTGTVVFVAVTQTLAPLFGLNAGAPSDATIGAMIGAVVTMVTGVALKVARNVRGNGS